MIKLKFKPDTCGYCGACVSVCHENVLSLDEWQLNIGPGCVECESCIFTCPLGALEK